MTCISVKREKTMSNFAEELIEQLQLDPGSPEAEWSLVEQLLSQSPSEASAILEYIFAQHQGYVDTRTRAGLRVLQHSPEIGWSILDQLVVSGDPDDRETALSVVSTLQDPHAIELAICLLDDPYPHLRLDAAEFLIPYVPDIVKTGVSGLLDNQEEWVRQRAGRLLIGIGTTL